MLIAVAPEDRRHLRLVGAPHPDDYAAVVVGVATLQERLDEFGGRRRSELADALAVDETTTILQHEQRTEITERALLRPLGIATTAQDEQVPRGQEAAQAGQQRRARLGDRAVVVRDDYTPHPHQCRSAQADLSWFRNDRSHHATRPNSVRVPSPSRRTIPSRRRRADELIRNEGEPALARPAHQPVRAGQRTFNVVPVAQAPSLRD